MTLQQLATHTSSLPRALPPLKNDSTYNIKMIKAFLANWKPAYPVGTRYLYSNLGFGLLGYALENLLLLKKPYAEIDRSGYPRSARDEIHHGPGQGSA